MQAMRVRFAGRREPTAFETGRRISRLHDLSLPLRYRISILVVGVLGFATCGWTAAVLHFDIPAGSLAAAVAEFARQSRLQVEVSDQLLEGRTGQLVAGDLAPEQALQRLLAGTHLAYRFIDTTHVALFSAESEEPAELSAIEVKTDTESAYTTRVSATALKSDTPLIETPVAVHVVPRTVIDDQQNQTLRDSVSNVSGVLVSQGEFYDSFIMRGLDWTGGGGTGNVYRDGLQTERLTRTTDMAFVDHVDVVKGPASVLYGRIEPGGFVNYVNKKPQATAAYSVEQQFGNWQFSRTTADATGPLNDNGTVLYRLIGVADRSNSWVEFDHRDDKSLLAAITVKPTSRLVINLDFERFDYKMTAPGEGEVPIVGNRPLNLPRNFTVGDPILAGDLAYSPRRSVVGFDWTYTLSESWSVTHRFHLMDVNENQNVLGIQTFDGVSTIQRTAWIVKDWERHILATNVDVNGEVRTGAVDHKLTFGVDWYRYTDSASLFDGYVPTVVPDLDIYHPVYGNISLSAINGLGLPIVGLDQWSDYGVYAQDQMSFGDHWRFLVGGRYDEGKTAEGYGPSTLPPFYHDYAFSPRLAVLYKADEGLSLYASYSKSFGLNNGLAADGSRIAPEIGKQYEVGAKSSWLDGRLNLTAALYDLRKTNITDPDPLNPLLLIPVGEIRSRGLEIDLSGRITDHVSVIAAYSYDSVRLTSDTNGNQGHLRQGVPFNAGRIWAKYDSDVGGPTGWELGGGITYRGLRQGDDANTFQLPAYTRIDAMAAYRCKLGKTRVTARLNINNLFDKTYWDAANGLPGNSGYAAAFYGAPRSYVASLKFDF